MCVCVCVCEVASVFECDPVGCNPPGFSVHGVFQARALEWVAMLSSRGFSRARDQPHLLHLLHRQADSLPLSLFINAAAAAAESLQLCPTLCDPRDTSPPGSPLELINGAGFHKWNSHYESPLNVSCASLS